MLSKLPAYPKAREIEIKDRLAFKELMPSELSKLSDYNFTNVFAWHHAYKYRVSKLNECLILSGIYEKKPFFLCPIGKPDKVKETLLKLFEITKNDNKIPFIACIPETYIDGLKDPKFEIKEDRDNFDYVHLSSELAELPGQKYHAKKNLIRQFQTHYEAKIEELNQKTCNEAIKFSDHWCMQRDCESDEGLKKEQCAIYNMLKYFEALSLHGILVRIDGDIVGLSMGEKLNDDTYVVHVEKGDHHFRGIYQFINQALADHVTPEFKWINREQDLGLEGLRKAKTSYSPDHFVKKYRLDFVK